MTPSIYKKLKQASKVFYIDDEGKDHEITQDRADVLMAEEKYTVKFEGLEEQWPEYYDYGCSVHCYISPKDSKSFPPHIDPYDVKLVCLKGTKFVYTFPPESVKKIKAGESIFLPANTVHRAINQEYSIILSLGYE